MKLTKFSQFTFLVQTPNGARILIDPGKYNYSENFSPIDFGHVDLLIITHKHGDHHDPDAEAKIIADSKPKVITNSEVASFESVSNRNYEIVEVGQNLQFRDASITFTNTDHFAKGELVKNFGMYFEVDGKSFYHTSDTRYMEPNMFDFDRVKNCDVLTLPISNRGVVMGVDDAVVFTSKIQPRIVIPAHYDSPADKGRVKPEDFVEKFREFSERGVELGEISIKVMNFLDEIEI